MGLIIKLILLYIAFSLIKSLFRGFFLVKDIKSRASKIYDQQNQQHNNNSKHQDDVIDAEYTVLDKDK